MHHNRIAQCRFGLGAVSLIVAKRVLLRMLFKNHNVARTQVVLDYVLQKRVIVRALS